MVDDWGYSSTTPMRIVSMSSYDLRKPRRRAPEDGVAHKQALRDSHVGTLDKALDQAGANGWIIVSMKDDWKSVFPDR